MLTIWRFMTRLFQPNHNDTNTIKLDPHYYHPSDVDRITGVAYR